MDYNSLNSNILKLNSKIRYAGIYHIGNLQIFEKIQKGLSRFLEKEKTQDTLIHEYMRWKSRKQFTSNIGKPLYTITKYEKLNRLTIPLSQKALLMINTEPALEPNEIVDDVINLITKYVDDPDYTPRQPYLG